MNLQGIESYLHREIPITAAMGVRVESYNERELVLTAPLEPNHNHLGTAFGGSLSAIATLAGYGVIWLEIGHDRGHVVVKDSRLRFVRPVEGEIRAVCPRPDAETLAAFRKRFEETGRSRLTLSASIGDGAVEFEGTFVAIR